MLRVVEAKFGKETVQLSGISYAGRLGDSQAEVFVTAHLLTPAGTLTMKVPANLLIEVATDSPAGIAFLSRVHENEQDKARRHAHQRLQTELEYGDGFDSLFEERN